MAGPSVSQISEVVRQLSTITGCNYSHTSMHSENGYFMYFIAICINEKIMPYAIISPLRLPKYIFEEALFIGTGKAYVAWQHRKGKARE